MEDVNGGLFVLGISLPTIERKRMNMMSMTDTEWEILEIKALGIIELCIAASVDFNI